MKPGAAKKGLRVFFLILFVVLCATVGWLYHANKKYVLLLRSTRAVLKSVNWAGKPISPLTGSFKLRADLQGMAIAMDGCFAYENPLRYDLTIQGPQGPWRVVRSGDLWIHFLRSNVVLRGIQGKSVEGQAPLARRWGFLSPASLPTIAILPGSLDPFVKRKLPFMSDVQFDCRKAPDGFYEFSLLPLKPFKDVQVEEVKVAVKAKDLLPRRMSCSGQYKTFKFLGEVLCEDIQRTGTFPVFTPPENALVHEMPLEDLQALLKASVRIHDRQPADAAPVIEPAQ